MEIGKDLRIVWTSEYNADSVLEVCVRGQWKPLPVVMAGLSPRRKADFLTYINQRLKHQSKRLSYAEFEDMFLITEDFGIRVRQDESDDFDRDEHWTPLAL